MERPNQSLQHGLWQRHEPEEEAEWKYELAGRRGTEDQRETTDPKKYEREHSEGKLVVVEAFIAAQPGYNGNG